MPIITPKTLAKLLQAAAKIEPAIPAALEATAPVTHSAALDALGPAVSIPGARPAGVSIPGARRVGDPAPRPQAPATAPPQPLLPVDAQLQVPAAQRQRVVFRGKEPKDWEPHDFHDFGQQYGVPNLGPPDSAKWRASLTPVTLKDGRKVTLPDLDKPLTYYDLQHIQAQGLDPEMLPEKLRLPLHNAMVAAVQPAGKASDLQVARGQMMGLLSPNNDLTSNQFAVAATMPRGPQDIDFLASQTPWRYTDKEIPPLDVRKPWATDPKTGERLLNKKGQPYRLNPAGSAIAEHYNIHANPGMGVRGTQDPTVLAGFAQRFQDNPDFFRMDPANFPPGYTPGQQWAGHVERVMNAQPGLSAKTASFGNVWQDPQNAAISAIDRHMASKMHGSLFTNPKEQAAWEKDVFKKFNADRGLKGANKVTSVEQMRAIPGGIGAMTEASQNYLNAAPGALTRPIKMKGEYNPELPEHLRDVNWPGGVEPSHMTMVPPPYARALDVNAQDAAAKGQGLFSNQWFNWDPIRKRIEPHSIMFPGLEKLPPFSPEQLQGALQNYKEAKYFPATAKIKPMSDAAKAAFWGIPAAVLGGAAPFMPGATAIGDPRQQTY